MTQLEVISWTLFFIVIIGGLWYHFKISDENNKKIDEIVNTIKEVNTISIKDNSNVVLPYDEYSIKYWLAYYENEVNNKLKQQMKKYKLIKPYPMFIGDKNITNKFPIGTEVHLIGIRYHHPTYAISFSMSEIEEYSDYWQEIKQKEYEITAFRGQMGTIKGHYYKLENKDSFRGPYGDYTLEYLLSCINLPKTSNPVEIYSVKRLSDNVEFKIGDNVTYCKNQYKIISFNVLNTNASNKMVVTVDWSLKMGQQYEYELNSVQHAKQPLFTTEDGVEIFKDDKYWVVRTDKFGSKEFHWDITGPEFGKDNIKYTQIANKEHGVFWFSTKEAAEQYIIENKPCLSYKEFEQIILKTRRRNEAIENIKQFIKTKLKL